MTVGDVGSVISVLKSYTWLNSLDFERASRSLYLALFRTTQRQVEPRMDRLENGRLERAYIVQIAQLCIKYITSVPQHPPESPASSTLFAYQISILPPKDN